VLRQHGHHSPDGIHLAIFEARGAVSVLPHPPTAPPDPASPPGADGSTGPPCRRPRWRG
jgi:uncharacterized membrane protein YcaP (DUF421 family)